MYGIYSFHGGGNSADAVQLLKDLGFDLNRPRDESDRDALIHFAVEAGSAESIEKLARLGANLNQTGSHKGTPLVRAVMNWGDDLEQYKIYTEAVQKFQATKVRNGEIAARALVRNGADLNARSSEDGRTVLLQAALQNRPDIMQFLISAGARTDMRDFTGDGLAKYVEYGKNKALYNEEKRQKQLADSRATRELLGKIATTTVAAGVIASTNMPAENKVQLLGAVATDVAANGQPGATAALNQQSANRQPAVSSSSGARENGAATGPAAKKQRKKFTFEGFNDNGVMAATSDLAIKLDVAQVKKVAEKWVSERRNGSESANAVITEFRVRECTAMGGNPLYRRCILDVTYEADAPY
jgi:hypothetical protein